MIASNDRLDIVDVPVRMNPPFGSSFIDRPISTPLPPNVFLHFCLPMLFVFTTKISFFPFPKLEDSPVKI